MSGAETFAAFVSAYVGQVVGYFAFVGVVFWVTRRWLAARLAGRRIATRAPPLKNAQLVHEARHSLVVMAIGTAQVLVVHELQRRGWTRLSDDLGPWGLPGAAVSLALLVIFNDAWFYGVHRVLHTRWWFQHVHAVHHRSIDVTPLTSYSFHAVEALLITSWLIPAVLWLPIPMPVLMAAQAIGLLNNVMAHLGYELLPRWWVKAPLLRWSNTATFHSLHHQRYTGNYGLFTRFWDRLFGTELDGYEAAFLRARATARTSGDVSGTEREPALVASSPGGSLPSSRTVPRPDHHR